MVVSMSCDWKRNVEEMNKYLFNYVFSYLLIYFTIYLII